MDQEICVLHVDDEPGFADLTQDFLERVDDTFSVATATGADAAQAHLVEEEIDCIVSDYDMPETDGLEFLEMVREEYPDLPFILFTGKGSEEVASEAISAGVTDYLQKESGTSHYRVLANRVRNAVSMARERERRELLEGVRSLVNTVNEALVRTSTVVEIEQRVCEILAREEQYRFAVIAGVDRDTLTIHPRTWAGTGEEFLQNFSMSVQEGAPGRNAPGGKAYHERELGVVQQIRSDPRYADWRDQALEHGFESLAVAPLEHEDELHGLLAIFSARPRAFASLERDLIEELADDIAHALRAAKAEAELREHEAELTEYKEYTERVLDALDDVFFVHDSEGRPVRWNESFREVTGYSDEEIRSMKGVDFVPEEFRDVARQRIQAVFETGRATLEAPILTKEGGEIPYEFSATRVRGTDGEPQLVGLGRNIQERHSRESDLAHSQRRYRVLAENFPNGAVFLLDRDLRFQLVSGRGFDLVDASPDDMVGKKITEVEAFSGDMVVFLETIYTEALEGEHIQTELSFEDRVYDLRAVPVRDEEDTVTNVLAITQDITERADRETRLEEKNEQLEEFASIVSHDLRNPLNIAKARTELAMEECDSEHLESVVTAQNRMETLIGDLLELAREGTSVGESDTVDFAPLVRESWAQIDAQQASLNIETEMQIRADRNRLQQLIENLGRNAVDHAGPNVTVTVSELADENGFFVADDGPGIPSEERSKIFEPGFTTEEGSTGIGLLIVEDIVDAHGWSIDVAESDAGGVRFEITGVDIVSD